MGTLRPFELDPFDLLWRDLFSQHTNFSAITQKISHPVDIYETETGISFEIAAVGLSNEDIEISIDGELLRIRYEKPQKAKSDNQIYSGIKRSGFDLSWKISNKFDLSQLKASLDRGLLILDIPIAEGKVVQRIEITTPKQKLENKKK